MIDRATLILIVLLAAIAGLILVLPAGAPQTTPEPSWEAQLEAVRSGSADRILMASHVITDEQFEELRGAVGLRHLQLERGQFSTETLNVLTGLPDLTTLWLGECRVDNDAAREIGQCSKTTALNLPQARFDDDGLRSLAALPHLQQLRFSSPYVTSKGLRTLGGARSLRLLHLIDLPVDGTTLDAIATLDHLESLYLDGVTLNSTAIESFFAARPDVHVHVDQLHHHRDPNVHQHAPGKDPRPQPHAHPPR